MKSQCVSFSLCFAILLGSFGASAQIDEHRSVLTQRNDHWRRGAYLAETKLTVSNVNKSTFGWLYKLDVEGGPILAQPLFAKGVNIAGKPRDVLYVATRMNRIYAFDVSKDVPFNSKHEPLWKVKLPAVPSAPLNQPVTAVWRDPKHPEHLDLFIVGIDGRVLSNFWEKDSGWHQWFSIRPDTAVAAANTKQQITAVWGDPSNPQHLNLFMVDKDGTVKSIFCTLQINKPCWQNEAWFAIGSPGIATQGQPVTAVWRDKAFSHLDLFIAGKDGRVLSNFWEKDSGWHEWFAIRPDTALAAAGVPQQITAVWGDPSNPQHLNLFMVDTDHTVKSIFCTLQINRHCWQNEAWFPISPNSAWISPGQPVTAVWRDGAFSHLDLFMAGIQHSGLYLKPKDQQLGVLPGLDEKPIVREGVILSNFWEPDLNVEPVGWGTWFPLPLRAEALPGMDDGQEPTCQQTHGPVGIMSTPVIDPKTNTMFVVYRTGLPLDLEPHHHLLLLNENRRYRFDSHHWLAKIDLATGHILQAPTEIVADGFDPTMQLNRPGLLLHGDNVIVAFGAAVCDNGGNPYVNEENGPHGWIFAYRTSDLSRKAWFSTALGDKDGKHSVNKSVIAGIWQSGTGLASDDQGNIYAFTGNNNRPNDITNPDYSESILRLRLESDSFTVDHYQVPEAKNLDKGGNDGDLGAGAPILPFNSMLMGGGKQGVLYTIKDPATRAWPLQGVSSFQAFFNSRKSGSEVKEPEPRDCKTKSIDAYGPQATGPNMHGSPVVWHPAGINFIYIYAMPEKDYVRAFRVQSGVVGPCPALTTETAANDVRSPDGMPGGFLSIFANGDRDGIVWASVHAEDHAENTFGEKVGRLIALNALTLEKLWEDKDDPNPEAAKEIPFAKFVPPTIAEGYVFRAAYKGTVHVYGLKPTAPIIKSQKRPSTHTYQ